MNESVGDDKYTGRRLRSLRIQAGLTQQDLATRIGVNQSTVGRWEAEEAEPSHSKAMRLASALKVDAAGLPDVYSRRDSSAASEDDLDTKQARARSVGHEELLSERLERLENKLSALEATGFDGQIYSQRICGDLYRLMNTALLNCSDLLCQHERLREQERSLPATAKAAMEYAASVEGGQAYLKLWLAGDHDAIRLDWPDAPAM